MRKDETVSKYSSKQTKAQEGKKPPSTSYISCKMIPNVDNTVVAYLQRKTSAFDLSNLGTLQIA